MADSSRLTQRTLTVATWLAIPVMIVALLRAGTDGLGQIRVWQEGRTHRSLTDSIGSVSERRIVLGDRRARLTLLEFMDYQCPGCRAVDSVLRNAFEGRDVRVLALHFPLESIHPLARRTAVAAVCVEAQGQLERFHHFLFREGVPQDRDSLQALARTAGAKDPVAFEKCLAGDSASLIVDRDVAWGTRLGVRGTPTFVGPDGAHTPSSDILLLARGRGIESGWDRRQRDTGESRTRTSTR